MNARFKGGDAYATTLPWDVLHHDHLHRELAIQVLSVTKSLPVGTILRVIDVGCGIKPALCHPFLKQSLDHLRLDVTMIDLSDEAIARVERDALPKLAEMYGPLSEFRAIRIAAEDLAPGAMGTFDLAVSVESIEHWSDVDRGIIGVRDCLKEGGSFVFTTPNRDALHVRMGRKLGFEAPFCARDHVYEFGWKEIDRIVEKHRFRCVGFGGAGLTPYWALEGFLGGRMRDLTDRDVEVIEWLDSIGNRAPEFAFCQIKRFVAV